MRDTTIDEAARRTAINLMRLSERIELEDAERSYTDRLTISGETKRQARVRRVREDFRNWFRDHAR